MAVDSGVDDLAYVNYRIHAVYDARQMTGEGGTMQSSPFDTVELLGNLEAQTELLRDALKTGDPGYIANALGVVVRARGATQIAKEAGVGRESLYKSLRPNGNPTLSTVIRVLNALGIKLEAVPA